MIASKRIKHAFTLDKVCHGPFQMAYIQFGGIYSVNFTLIEKSFCQFILADCVESGRNIL